MGIPSLRLHTTGQWFTTWQRKSRYFGADKSIATEKYIAWLNAEYLPWAASRSLDRSAAAGGPEHLLALAELWLADVQARGAARSTIDNYRRGLNPLLHALGTVPLASIDTAALIAVRDDLVDTGRASKTINNTLNVWRMLIRWAGPEGLNHIRGVSARAVRGVHSEPPHPLVFTPRHIRQMIRRAALAWQSGHASFDLFTGPHEPLSIKALSGSRSHSAANPAIARDVFHWLSLQYLTACRPSEVVRLVHRQGVFEQPFLFRLHRSKTSRKTQSHRYLILSPEALHHFNLATPRWKTPSGYQHAVGKALGPCGWPHPLRHSAASQLDALGTRREDIARILGHVTTGALKHYLKTAHARLLPTVARLTLRSARGQSCGEPSGASSRPSAGGGGDQGIEGSGD
jgi:integrase